MKIASIQIRKEDLQISRPYTIAFKTIDHVENGIIEIVADNGMKGMGAFNPSYEVVGEHLEDAMLALNEQRLQWLIGTRLDDIEGLCAKVQQEFAASPGARTGLEIALYDLYTQSIGKSLVSYLGQQIYSMRTSITIGIKNVQETLAEAEEYTGRGFNLLKIKLGISLDEDVERLVKLREQFGESIDLIIDANQGYDQKELQRFCKEISGLNIQLIEQPLKAGEEASMRTLPAAIKKLVAADESLITADDAVKLAAAPSACGFFNIKLMKCGGISQALKIARTGADHQIDLMWGCNDESIVSITAALHTAFASAHTKFIDLDGSLDLARDVVKAGFILENGIMSIPDKPGLGLTLLD